MSERLAVDVSERIERQSIDDDQPFRDFVVCKIIGDCRENENEKLFTLPVRKLKKADDAMSHRAIWQTYNCSPQDGRTGGYERILHLHRRNVLPRSNDDFVLTPHKPKLLALARA
ncbi:hypothetical protein ACM42_11565 [Bradyrhizobium sp. CCBAU 25338]|nr:hypothetical protein [Bradyrhizobium sp. CCBAU 25338]